MCGRSAVDPLSFRALPFFGEHSFDDVERAYRVSPELFKFTDTRAPAVGHLITVRMLGLPFLSPLSNFQVAIHRSMT